jgi:hypothetical protein
MKRTRGFVLDKVEHRDTIPDGTEQRIAIGREENIPLLVNRAAYVGELRARVRSHPSTDSRDEHLVVRLHFFWRSRSKLQSNKDKLQFGHYGPGRPG